MGYVDLVLVVDHASSSVRDTGGPGLYHRSFIVTHEGMRGLSLVRIRIRIRFDPSTSWLGEDAVMTLLPVLGVLLMGSLVRIIHPLNLTHLNPITFPEPYDG